MEVFRVIHTTFWFDEEEENAVISYHQRKLKTLSSAIGNNFLYVATHR